MTFFTRLIQHPDECDQKIPPEADKRMRREIANSNERRRMQCINAGFSSLRALIPQLEGEKLSKVIIIIYLLMRSLLQTWKQCLRTFLTEITQIALKCGHFKRKFTHKCR